MKGADTFIFAFDYLACVGSRPRAAFERWSCRWATSSALAAENAFMI
jgi:hypothetical protein